MVNTATVTIAIPVYNAMPYLRDAIQSVVNQTYKDWVLYLINDGSTDGSYSIMMDFERVDNRIVVINDNLNKGLIARLNQSVSLCNTKYYARMDADDIMHVTRIEDQVTFLESQQHVDVCGSSIMTIDSKNNIIGSGFCEGKVATLNHPTVMGRTQWFKNNQYVGWANRAEDLELWLRTSSSSVFYAIGKPLLFYREFGVPSYRKYCLTQITIMKVASHYKFYNKSYAWYIETVLVAIIKIIVATLLNSVGKMNIMLSMRRRKQVPNNIALSKFDLLKAIE